MLRIFVIVVSLLTINLLPIRCQKSEEGWGPWKRLTLETTGMKVRTKCESTANGDSKWAYQFKSFHGLPMDFVEQEEHAVPHSRRNELGPPSLFTVDGQNTPSPVFETEVHGTCAEVHEIKIVFICVIKHDQVDPCTDDTEGYPLEMKKVPPTPGRDTSGQKRD